MLSEMGLSGSSGGSKRKPISVPTPIKTGKRNLDFFRGGSKFNYNIGKHDFWINTLKRARPQDVVVLDD